MAGWENMETLQRDSRPMGQQQQQQAQGRSAEDDSSLKVGIFHADTDIHIARRLAENFKSHGCNAELFDFADAGQAVMGHLESFITSKNLVLWIATDTSLNNDGILKAARHISQYASIDRKELGIRFAPFKPREYLSARLPLVLDAYSSLKEDEQFSDRIKTTIKSVKAKMANRNQRAADGSSTANTNAVGGNAPDLSLISPASDQTTESPLRIRSDAPVKSAATPFPTYDEDSQGQGASGSTQAPPLPDASMYGPGVVNVIHIHDSKVRISTGSDQPTGEGTSSSQEKKKPKPDKDEGTPV